MRVKVTWRVVGVEVHELVLTVHPHGLGVYECGVGEACQDTQVDVALFVFVVASVWGWVVCVCVCVCVCAGVR